MAETSVAAFTKEHVPGIRCEDVIKCVLEISNEGWGIYHYLVEHGPVRVEEVANFLGKDRSTAYRELQKLINCGVCSKEPNNLREGGYYFLYHPKPAEELKRETEKCIDRTYEMLKNAINSNFNLPLDAEQ